MKNGLEGAKLRKRKKELKRSFYFIRFLFYFHVLRILNPKEIKLLNKQFPHVMKTLVLNHLELLLFKFLH